MSRSHRSRLAIAISLSVVIAGAAWPQGDPHDGASHDTDPRSVIVLDYLCSNELGRRQITLFANGTVRLRQGLYEDEQMHLAEIGPDELAETLELLGRRDATDDQSDLSVWGRALDGPFIEDCSLSLELEDREEERWEFSKYDTPPLRVAWLLRLAEDLARLTEPERPEQELSPDYEPVPGHLLRNAAGQLFRVTGFTTDLEGIELQAVDQPVVVYVSRENLVKHFFPAAELDEP